MGHKEVQEQYTEYPALSLSLSLSLYIYIYIYIYEMVHVVVKLSPWKTKTRLFRIINMATDGLVMQGSCPPGQSIDQVLPQ